MVNNKRTIYIIRKTIVKQMRCYITIICHIANTASKIVKMLPLEILSQSVDNVDVVMDFCSRQQFLVQIFLAFHI